MLDTVRLLAPSQTQTYRIGVISSLRYTVAPGQTVRVAYTYDRGRHRQTGETGRLQFNGQPFDVFPVNDPVLDVNGNAPQKRDRLSYAILHQFAGQYNGEFFDGTFRVDAGVSMKFLRRNLTNYCATSSAAGFIECFGADSAGQAAWLAANPTQTVPFAAGVEGATCPANPTPATNCTFATQGPQQRIVDYKRLLPNIGYIADITDKLSLYGNFSQSIQVPGTDNLYNSFYYPITADQANPKPESTDNFETGLRYRSSRVQAQVADVVIVPHHHRWNLP